MTASMQVDRSPSSTGWIAPGPTRSAPPLVFLHEGLGCVELWRTFPDDGRATSWAARRRSCTRGPATAARRWSPNLATDLHARRSARRAAGDAGAARARAARAHRPQRRRLDRPHPRRRRPPGRRPGAAGAPRVRRGAFDRRHRGRPRRLSDNGLRPSASAGITTTRTPRSGDGTTSGCRPSSGPGTSRRRSPASTAPVLVVQGDADEYGTLAQLDAIERTATGPVESGRAAWSTDIRRTSTIGQRPWRRSWRSPAGAIPGDEPQPAQGFVVDVVVEEVVVGLVVDVLDVVDEEVVVGLVVDVDVDVVVCDVVVGWVVGVEVPHVWSTASSAVVVEGVVGRWFRRVVAVERTGCASKAIRTTPTRRRAVLR